jgi:LuxR family maltose regulon positive regulatory protein
MAGVRGNQGASLSQREIEVLRLVAAGKSNPQIAQARVISLNTVQRHVSNILTKTGAANRTELAGYARDVKSV